MNARILTRNQDITMDCRFELTRLDGASCQVCLVVDGEKLVDDFDFEFFLTDRPNDIIGRLEKSGCKNQELSELGIHLWNALRPNKIAERLSMIEGPYGITIACQDDALSHLPWEALFDEEREAYLANDSAHPLWRDLPTVPARPDGAGPLRMLVVVPEGSELDTASEIAALNRLSKKFGAQRLTVAVIDGMVTSDRIQDELEKPYDIFHFIGHSRQVPQTNGIEVRINAVDVADGEQWLDANQFADLLTDSSVRLAVFNSCEIAASAAPIMGGLGRQLARRAGIPAVVAMRYKIDDVSSRNFAEAFYRELLSADHAGRVDAAMQEARRSLYTRARTAMMRSFITPVLYLSPGHAQLFNPDRISALPQGVLPVGDAAARAIPIEKDLLDFLRGGRCMAVIGAGVHRPALREALPVPPAPTLLRLVNELAAEAKYADDDELDVAKSVADFAAVVCPRIFQYYQSEKKRWALIDWLQAHCPAAAVPPILLRIATWKTLTGIVYTHFDGLMEEALLRQGRRDDYRPVNMPKPPLAATGQPQANAAPMLLFNLRGTLTDTDSLVLTDSDHERLMDDLAEANAEVKDLFRRGRAVLFVGVSPFDQAVRRMARLYLKTGNAAQGPRYFVCPRPSSGDKAYWNEFAVTWIEEEPDRFVEAVDAALQGHA
jgi:hypothetical protein